MSARIYNFLLTTVFRVFYLPNGSDSAAISNRIYEGFATPSRLTLKRHLFITHMHKKLFKAIREISLSDKKDEFKREMLRQSS